MYLSTVKLGVIQAEWIARNALYQRRSGRIRGRDDKAKEQSGGPWVHVVPGKLATLPK
jgi:hypothetical protein